MHKLLIVLFLATPLFADDNIDRAVTEILAKTGAPSASIAVVRDGTLAYAKAYGLAVLDPKTPATPTMRYSIGSISKQFTASAILMLAEEGKLSLDDRVARVSSGSQRTTRSSSDSFLSSASIRIADAVNCLLIEPML